jgi:hypothetical protein
MANSVHQRLHFYVFEHGCWPVCSGVAGKEQVQGFFAEPHFECIIIFCAERKAIIAAVSFPNCISHVLYAPVG